MSEPGWEYRLFTQVLKDGVSNLRAKRYDHDIEHASTMRTLATSWEAVEFVRAALREMDRVMESMAALLSEDKQVWMFGEPGEPGDADRIRHIGERFVGGYEEMLDWAADVRGTAVPRECRALFAATARLATGPLGQIESFVEQFFAIARGDKRADTHLRLSFECDTSEVEQLFGQLGV